MAADPDEALVAAARDGDRAALDALLRRHHDRVHALCRRLAGNEADALDATQEALIAIVRGLPRFDGRARFSTWVHRVATNACLDELRRRGRRPIVGLPDERDPETAGPVPDPRAQAATEAVADRIELDGALARLRPEFRAAVVLRDLCELDYAEIAEVLDLPPGTVRSRIARGRAQLAGHLGPGNHEAPPRRPTTTSPEPPP
ncbi:MAG: RNA polymerase sigma factor, partial [Actinomycetota bacterium]